MSIVKELSEAARAPGAPKILGRAAAEIIRLSEELDVMEADGKDAARRLANLILAGNAVAGELEEAAKETRVGALNGFAAKLRTAIGRASS